PSGHRTRASPPPRDFIANRSSGAMLAAASIEYRNNVYMPLASITMPVRKGQYWVVAACSGHGATEEAVAIYFSELQLLNASSLDQ
ncbi:MAG: hypothetical protein OXN89_00980, partial [Bryobacterales bacterium]|nr:hypothetical protein [Bryobacterales bacterium]